jgi:hypothetical protein
MAGNLAFVGSYAETPNAELTAFFEKWSARCPPSLLLLSAVCTPEGITMNLTTPGHGGGRVVIDSCVDLRARLLTVSTITESTDDDRLHHRFLSVSAPIRSGSSVAPAAALTQ